MSFSAIRQEQELITKAFCLTNECRTLLWKISLRLYIVEDPSYYKEISIFDEFYGIVKKSGINFLNFLIEKHNLTVQTNL